MTIREEMHSLGQNIIHSYADRMGGIAQLKSDVGVMIRGFGDAQNAMGRALRAHLAKVAPDLEDAEAERERTATQEIAQRQSDVGAMLQGFHDEQAGAREEWGKLTATMQAKRRGIPTPPMAGLDKRVFHYLANHPNGAKMTKLEQEFGTPRIQMAKALKDLMDENKAKKQNLLYFAT